MTFNRFTWVGFVVTKLLVVINFFAQILPPCFWQDAIEDDEVKRLKTAAYAQKAQYQSMVKELSKAIKELAKVDSD